MKNTLIVCVLFILGCNSNGDSYDSTIVPTQKDSLTYKPYFEKRDLITVDIDLKNKVRDAFELLRKYGMETKVMPKKVSYELFSSWPKIIFGKAKIYKGAVEFQIEDDSASLFKDLIILFEDIPLSKSNHAGETLYLAGVNRPVVSLVSEFVKNMSLELVASVILHELRHLQFFNANYLQKETEIDKNEHQAYMAQLYFLAYAYGGPDKEKQCYEARSNNIDVKVPLADLSEFTYYFNKAKELATKY